MHCFLTYPFIFCHYFGTSYTFCTLPSSPRSACQWSAGFIVPDCLEMESFEFFTSSQNGAYMSVTCHLVSVLWAATLLFSRAKTSVLHERSLKNDVLFSSYNEVLQLKIVKNSHPAKSLQTHLLSLKSIFKSKLNWVKFLPRCQE